MSESSIKKNAVYNAVKTCSAIVFPLITFPYISRVLLVEGVGKVNFGLSVVSYFSLLAGLGITTYAVRECAAARRDRDALSRVASQLLSMNVFTTLVAYVLLAATLLLFSELEEYRALIAVQSTVILFATLGADWLNTAMEDFKFITVRTVTFQLLALVLMFVFVREPGDYMKYAAISVVASAGASVVNIWYRQRLCKVSLTVHVDWRRHFPSVMLLFAMALAQTMLNNVDVTMLGLMRGDGAAGVYSTAHKISNVLNQLVASLLWVILPRLSLYFAEEDYDKVNALLRKVLGFNLVVGLPVIVGVTMVAGDIVYVFAGPGYEGAASVLQILMLALFFSLIGGNFLGNAVLLPSKRERYYMIVCCIAVVANVVLNLLLIPAYGADGAAFATAACSLLILVLLAFRVDKRLRIERVGTVVASPLIGCAMVLLACLALSFVPSAWVRLPLSIAASVIAYLVVMVASKNEFATELIGIARSKIAGNRS